MNDATPTEKVTSATSAAGSPRTLRVRKAGMILVSTLALPLGLTACGLMSSGGDDTQAPVIIPGEQVPGETVAQSDPSSVTGSDPSSVASVSSAAVTASVAGAAAPSVTSAVAAAPAPVTVTSTDVVVRRETRLRTVTKVPPAVTRTPPPVTQTQTTTETKTETKTETQTLISVLPAKTLTRTATKTVTKTVTKK